MNECEIFIAALDKSVLNERDAFLEQACGGNAELRQRIESLLESHGQAGSLLEHPALGAAATALLEQSEVSTDGSANFSARQVMLPDEIPLDFLAPSEDPQALGCLGPYTVTARIGRGGMGVVLKAQDAKLNRVVAIKVMAPELASNTTAKMRFVREARATASVVHQHVVTIHAVDEDRLPYLVMEYIDGQSLQEKIDREGYLEFTEILRIGQQVASGLAAAHAHGLTHRDVKPANILLENSVERVRITDFGLARVADDASTSQTGLIAGTPQYMSPEQARGEIIDSRSDLFSLGSTLYAMCTGRAPFRAANSIAVLKRVCDDAPSPIRETNPSIPQWLVDLIDKLQAKDPAERVQSAGEVAEQLRQYRAGELDTAGLPAVGKPPRASGGKRLRWALAAAAAVLLCFAGALSLTEATGVTKLSATVIRIFTPDGTLVVETGDPAVKVTVEGDGGLRITGAGLEEIRLRPGSYRVHADKDGQPVPLDKDLVTVTRGDRAIVKVKLESSLTTAAGKAEKEAFVVLGGQGLAECKFDTLAEAVIGASDGDTIEIRGNGPFVTEHIEIDYPLTIRAGAGFRPVILDSPQSAIRGDHELILARGPLLLEGLEFRCTHLVQIVTALDSFAAASCRFYIPFIRTEALWCRTDANIKNCEVIVPKGAGLWFSCDSEAAIAVTNCLLVGHHNFDERDTSRAPNVRFERNTLVSPHSAFLQLMHIPRSEYTNPALKRLRFTATDNIFACDGGTYCVVQEPYVKPLLDAADAEVWLSRRVEWREARNVYVPAIPLIRSEIAFERALESTRGKDLDDWNRFWGLTDTGSSQGVVRFQGGDLLAQAGVNAAKLIPEDFRLRPDSAGYRAGPDGKDLGADVDLVGPGPAYERWKNTPEYEEWLKETGQKK